MGIRHRACRLQSAGTIAIAEAQMINRTLLLLAIPVVAVGCNGSAPIVGATPIVGTWSGTDETNGLAQTSTFDNGGGYSSDENGGLGMQHKKGTYKIDGDSLELDLVSDVPPHIRWRERSTYYISSDGSELALFALRPEGSHDGVVGTWSNAYEAETLDDKGAVQMVIYNIAEHWTLNLDGTAVRAVVIAGSGNGSAMEKGTWQLDADRRKVTLKLDGLSYVPTLTLMDGQVMSEVILTRK